MSRVLRSVSLCLARVNLDRTSLTCERKTGEINTQEKDKLPTTKGPLLDYED